MMNEPPQIKNPSITLYPFHLRNDGDEGYQEPAQNADRIWQHLADNVGGKFEFPELKALRNQLICYKDGKYHPAGEDANLSDPKLLKNGKPLNFTPLTQPNYPNLRGSINARRINDTYAADLTLYYQNATILVADLKQLNPEGCLLSNQIQASLGQTLFLYAEPVVYDDYRSLADKCVRALVGDGIETELQITGTGELFGSPIFEYDNSAKKCHILVWLQQNPDTLKLATSTFNYHLMNLLCARSKILFVYNQAKESYCLGQQIATKLDKLRPEFTQIESEPNREVKLTKLKSLLATVRSLVFDYTKELRHLREFSNTIDINTENYEDAYVKIKELSVDGDNLLFLEKFRSLCDRKYQSQIQKYLNYLMANQDLFQQTISTIRGMVEIEQAELSREQAEREHQRDREQIQLYQQKEQEQKDRDEAQIQLDKANEDKERKRDRQLENTIFFVGTAIGGGQIFSAAYPLIKDTPIYLLPDFSRPLHPFTATIFWSLVFGIVFGLLILGILPLARRILPKIVPLVRKILP
ncbi:MULTISPECIES: hypothetical protein [unclassified Microcoleus]|uniref:hypothetical protein n=1 Tax=unclassified Microcoleus TaxID=2642155 RepID=UPI002FD50949